VQLQGLSGRFPDRLAVQSLLISDAKGPWLRADDVHLDWSPMALLRDEIRIRTVDAAQASVLRRPAYGSARPMPGAHGGFSLPLALQIDQVRLPRVFLGAPLAGSDVNLRLQGAVMYRSLQRAEARLSVQRLDAVPATYLLTADIRPRRLALQLDVEEQADGPLANLLRVPGMGALSVHLLLDGPRTAIDTRLDAHAGSLTASASGSMDLRHLAAQLSISVQAAAMSPLPQLGWQSLSLQAQAHGALTAPTTSAVVTLEGLHYQSIALDRLQGSVQGVGEGLSVQAQLAGLTLPAPLGELLHASPLALMGQLRFGRGEKLALDLTASHALLQASGHYALDLSARGHAGSQSADFTATVANLMPWTSMVALPLSGRGTVQGQLRELSAGPQLSGSAALMITGGAKPWAALLAPRATAAVTFDFASGSQRLTHAELTSPHLALTASGGFHGGGALDIDWNATRIDLAALYPAARGQMHAQGHVQGTVPNLLLTASADARGAVHTANGALHATLEARDVPLRASGRLLLSGTLDQAPVAVQASLQREESKALVLRIQQGRWKSVQLAGMLQVDGDLSAPAGHLSLSVPRLADVDPLLGTSLQGLQGQLALGVSGKHSRALITLSAQDIALSAVRLHTLSVQGSIDQPLDSPRAALQLNATGKLAGITSVVSIDATGAFSHLTLATHADIGGDAQSATASAPATATATATALDAQAIWLGATDQLQLINLTAQYRDQRLRLLRPATLSFNGGISVTQLRLGVPPAVVQLQGQITPALALRGTVRRLSPAALGIFLPEFRGLQPRGEASADVVLGGTLSDPRGTVDFSASGLHAAGAGVQGLTDASITLHAALAARVTTLQLSLTAGPQMMLHAEGRVPLDRTQPVALNVNGNVDLAFANAILEAGGQRALGELTVQAQLAGTLASPQLRGQLSLHKGELQDFSRGLRLSGIEAQMSAEGAQLTLTRMSAQAGSGTLSATGKIDLSAPGMPLQLTLNAHHAQPLRSDLLTADVDMALQLSGDLAPQDLSASGTVHVNRATINIPNAMPPAVAVLHVVRPGQQIIAPAPPRPLLAKLDLTVNAPNGIFVRGRGLAVQVGGTLHATGNSTAPTVTGGFDLISGTFDVAGTTLNFSNGRVGFTGSGLHNRIDPTLYFVASSYSGGITANLTVTGFADAPIITLSSTPPLPQDEILARLLFGESVAQLTPLQIAGIGSALVTISGVGSAGFNPLNTVQHALGLNRLVVTGNTSAGTTPGAAGAQNNSGATIEAGRYISNRLYVGARQSTTGTTQAQVQVDLTRGLKLQTTFSTGGGPVQGLINPENDPGSSVGVTYQFEF
jgi:translocation and assembly module TamB